MQALTKYQKTQAFQRYARRKGFSTATVRTTTSLRLAALREYREQMAPVINPKDRVKLAAFEDQSEERGIVQSVDAASQTAIVKVDERYQGRDDDGIREVPLDQISIP